MNDRNARRQAVIVDIDGTLLRSAAEDDRLYRQAVEDVMGSVVFRDDLSAYEPVTDSGILVQIAHDNDVELTDALIADVKAAFFAGVADYIRSHGPFEALPGACEFVGRLRASPTAEVAIATGGWRRSAEMKLATAGFDTDGIPIATSDDALDRTDIMTLALHSLPGSFAAVTYYGDGYWDRDACRRLGWRFQPVGPDLEGIVTFDHEFAS